jgi:hypothetical protein
MLFLVLCERARIMRQREILIENGEYYGYPACCVAEFCKLGLKSDAKRKVHRRGVPWWDTGFLPCASCRPFAMRNFARFVAERIAPNRKHDRPFPLGRELRA